MLEWAYMTSTIIIGISIAVLFAIVGIGFLLYSLITSKNTMNGETKTKAVDVFVYLGIGITLVMSVTNILQIVFTAIDRKFTDVLGATAYMDIYSSDVRMAIASLIVMYPIYLALSWYTAKDITKFLYKRDLTIRKVVIYTMLFVTACTLIGTLITIIYTYLGGDLTERFAWKAVAVAVVAALVGWYYLYSVRRDYTIKTSVPILASIVVTIMVIGSIVWSVSIIGTPAEMRAKRIDSQRLSDLSSLQQQIFSHFQTVDKLPMTLSELNNAFQGYVVPTDPITKESYGYSIKQQPVVKINYTTNQKELIAPAIFELWANFDIARDNNGQDRGGKSTGPISPIDLSYSVSNYYYESDQSPFWNHGTGEVCFKRIISSSMYYGK